MDTLTAESKIRIQREDFSVTDEIEAIKKVSRNIGGIVAFLGTGRELSKGQDITRMLIAVAISRPSNQSTTILVK